MNGGWPITANIMGPELDKLAEYSMALLFRAYRKGGKIIEIPTSWTGRRMAAKDEWKILKRFPGYWYWYERAIVKLPESSQSSLPSDHPKTAEQ